MQCGDFYYLFSQPSNPLAVAFLPHQPSLSIPPRQPSYTTVPLIISHLHAVLAEFFILPSSFFIYFLTFAVVQRLFIL